MKNEEVVAVEIFIGEKCKTEAAEKCRMERVFIVLLTHVGLCIFVFITS